ncbi:hypothetical protein HP456_09690 [Bacillus haikouensis]|jgi:hypothetical protein|uniref:hypothetical protein n=1 Tax=Bacillus haikouensis TaxID=1510468 RepID=UPI001555261E|nr:hypothetical protein [Bacillus haikouensis]NQD66187.1 hypothetical protein [Bacillus haikouensis]
MDEWYRELKRAGTEVEFEINQAIKAEINQREYVVAFKELMESIKGILEILSLVLMFLEFLNQKTLIENIK